MTTPTQLILERIDRMARAPLGCARLAAYGSDPRLGDLMADPYAPTPDQLAAIRQRNKEVALAQVYGKTDRVTVSLDAWKGPKPTPLDTILADYRHARVTALAEAIDARICNEFAGDMTMTQFAAPPILAPRTRLPETRPSLTHKRSVQGYKIYVHVSFYDGPTDEDRARPAEVFVVIAKHGTVVGGLMDGVARLTSYALQYGVPWEVLRAGFLHHKFGESDGVHASLLDALARIVDHLIVERARVIGAPIPAFLDDRA